MTLGFPLRLPWATQRIVCNQGDALHVAHHGLDRDRIVVCVPGLGDTWESFDALAATFPPTYGFVVVDALGHGRSSKQRGRNLPAHQSAAIDFSLDALGVEPFAVVGHSYGGVIAQQFADEHPELPAAVLMATLGSMRDHPAAAELIALAESMSDDALPPESFALQGDSFSKTVDQAVLAPYLAAMRLMPGFVMREVLLGLRDLDFSDLHGRWLPRTLLVMAEDDKVLGQTGMEALARAIPDAHAVTIPGTSHAMHWEHPELVGKAITEFLARVE